MRISKLRVALAAAVATGLLGGLVTVLVLDSGSAARPANAARATGSPVLGAAPASDGQASGSPTASPSGSASASRPAGGPLPYGQPSTAALRGSAHKVFAHYFPPYPISLDNKDGGSDYYARNYLPASGEGGKHTAYGGLLRDRPLPRAPLSGDWRLADMKTEVRQAIAAGIDGFTVDILSLSSDNWTRTKLLIQAAGQVDAGFRIVLMPDMTTLGGDAGALAAAMAELAASPSVYRLADGRLVISPFKAEQQSATWWQSFLTAMKDTHHLPVAFVPVFLDFGANLAAFAPISYGFSNWGNRSPNQQGGIAGNVSKAHAAGKIWMQSVAIQDERPRSGIYDEADNTENLRTSWGNTISAGADWVQLTTWNDYSEGTQFAPSARHGSAYLDISGYYLSRFKTGSWPAISRDVVYLTHRIQFVAARPTSGSQTKFMAPRDGTASPRDRVEVLTFLRAPAQLTATIAGKSSSTQLAAGVQTTLFALGYGSNEATVTRNGATVAAVRSPYPVSASFTVQDLQYYAVGSGR